MTNKMNREDTTIFQPQFDSFGLIPCITTCAKTKEVLMFAFMNAEALEKTIETGEVHYWSRSRKSIWHKGATSGAIQKVMSIKTDCDQDCLWISVNIENNPTDTCHTGRKTCFYRELDFKINPELLKIAK